MPHRPEVMFCLLARRRRFRAVKALIVAGLAGLLPLFVTVPAWAYLGCLVIASLSGLEAKQLWKRANLAE